MSVIFPPLSDPGYLERDDLIGPGGRTVMAEMPVTVPSIPKKMKQRTPQEAIDEFWSKFMTKAPGKGA
jgi:hypothetical protein